MNDLSESELKQIEKTAKRCGANPDSFVKALKILSPGKFNPSLLEDMSNLFPTLRQLCATTRENADHINQETDGLSNDRQTKETSLSNTQGKFASPPSPQAYKEAATTTTVTPSTPSSPS